MKKSYYPVTSRRPPDVHRRTYATGNSRPIPNSFQPREPQVQAKNRLNCPPGQSPSLHCPNFVVELRFDGRSCRRVDVGSLIAKCKTKPEGSCFYPRDGVACALFFSQWVDARDALVCLWEFRLNEVHDFTPELISRVLVPSDMDELQGSLRGLFAKHVNGLIEGKEVKRWLQNCERVSKEFTQVSHSLKRLNSVAQFNELCKRKEGLQAEKGLIERRIKEFQSAMECLLHYLEDNRMEETGEAVLPIFKLEGDFDWKRIYSVIKRERRRLEEG